MKVVVNVTRALWLSCIAIGLAQGRPVTAPAAANLSTVQVTAFGCEDPNILLNLARIGSDIEASAVVPSRWLRVDGSAYQAVLQIPPGHYLLTASDRKCGRTSMPITVVFGKQRDLQLGFKQGLLTLRDSYRALTGRLPFSGVRVALLHHGHEVDYVSVSNGQYYAEGLAPSRYILRVVLSDYSFHADIPVDLTTKAFFSVTIHDVTIPDIDRFIQFGYDGHSFEP